MKDMYLITSKTSTRAVDVYAASPAQAIREAVKYHHFSADDIIVTQRHWYA